MNNTFQISKNTGSGTIASNTQNSDKASFKESITGIEKFWNDLNTELEKKIKDRDELTRMSNEYQADDFSVIIDMVTHEIEKIRTKLNMIQVYFYPFIYVFLLVTILSVVFCLSYNTDELAAFMFYCIVILVAGYALFFTDSPDQPRTQRAEEEASQRQPYHIHLIISHVRNPAKRP